MEILIKREAAVILKISVRLGVKERKNILKSVEVNKKKLLNCSMTLSTAVGILCPGCTCRNPVLF